MRRIVALFASVLLSAAVAAESGLPPGIAWFDGPVASAFERAKQEGKPLFIYWGAVWCPPCNQIKKTILTRAEFAAKMKRFVPVYLDGDSEAAQIWGEKLGVVGYPTLLVLDSAGKEVLRLPTGLQLEAFLELLDEALRVATPIETVLTRAVAAGASEVADPDWRLLAFYPWEAGGELDLSRSEIQERLRALEARVPPRLAVEKSRLFTAWLASAVVVEKDEERVVPAPEEVERVDARLREILGEAPVLLANLEFLELHAGDVFHALYPVPSPARDRLAGAWLRAMQRVEENNALSVDERVTALMPAVELHRVFDPEAPFPEDLKRHVREAAAWADRMSRDDYTRQAAMSTAGALLKEVGLATEARSLYEAQLEKAASPHYFMSSLSALSREAGRNDEAIEWLRKAYEAARGRATRIQWGAAYVAGLLELAPDDETRIREESLRVFRELVAADDAFAGRNRIRSDRLALAFTRWNADGTHAASVVAIREAVVPSCASLSAESDASPEDAPRARCSRYFGSLGS